MDLMDEIESSVHTTLWVEMIEPGCVRVLDMAGIQDTA